MPNHKLHLARSCIILLFILLAFAETSFTQNVYKTPSGQKYHLASCHMVKNVSQKLNSDSEIRAYGLTPCKICKPPAQSALTFTGTTTNKAVGTSATVRCKGKTQRGTQCQHMTRLANGYCFQHTSQSNTSGSSNTTSSYSPSSTSRTYSTTCGARTQAGTPCKRKVSGGGRCYQHR